jgi:DMSO/TMAO reductase YedYZ molybdopterin-dependent catalytic subunit
MIVRLTARLALAGVAMFCVAPLGAQVTRDIVVEAAGVTAVLTAADLAALPSDTLRTRTHDGPEQVFIGPRLSAVLTRAGARLDSLRGRALAQYVLVEARDGYRVVLGVVELASDFTPRRIILAHSADGQPIGEGEGPWRLVVEGELRAARWVRQVSAIRLRDAPAGP